ncbi:MAG: autoinducer-2 kinase [Campylobacterales bacterium]|nr:autoinducer-2 kinase [Campylobacterales bacterium]
MEYLLALDLGTGSGRAVIFDTKGNQISVGQEEWTHLSEEGVEGSMNFDWDSNWELLKRCIAKALSDGNIDPKTIKAISSTSMREGIVLYDEDGKEIWAVANVDGRSSKEVKYLKDNFKGVEKKFYKESGQTFALGALPRLLWVKNNRPNIYKKTAKISMISDWALYKLSGEIAVDPSNGGTTGIFSLKKRDWSKKMAKKVGIKDDIFPPVYETGTKYAEITQEASEETGLAQGTPIVMGGGDVQLGSVGLGVVKKGECAVLGGTFWQQIVNMDEPLTHPKMDLRVNPNVITGQSQAEGITFFSGLIMRWFRDAFCYEEKNEGFQKGKDPYSILEEKAKGVPVGSHGIIPIFSDEMKYGKWYHAAPSFLNLSIDPEVCNKAAMFRSLQENAAIVSAENLGKIEKFTGVYIDSLVFAGGGAKGTLWGQILADVTGKTVKVPVVKEATALACAFAAGVGAGIYKSLEEAGTTLVQWEKEFTPDLDNHKEYNKIRKKWKKAYKKQLELVNNKTTTSMWKAPGL